MISKISKYIQQHWIGIFTIIFISCVGSYIYFVPSLKKDVVTVNVDTAISLNYTDYFQDYYGYDVDLKTQLPSVYTKPDTYIENIKVGPFAYRLCFEVVDTLAPVVSVTDAVIDTIDDVEHCFTIDDHSDVTFTYTANKVLQRWMSNGYHLYEIKYTARDSYENVTNGSSLILVTNGQTIGKGLGIDYSKSLKDCINQYCRKYGVDEKRIAYGYYDFINQSEIIHRGNESMVGASTYKLPLSMLMCDLINANYLSFDHTLTYKSEHYEIGAGTFESEHRINQQVKIIDCMEQSLYWSNNTASRVLLSLFKDFESFKDVALLYSPNSKFDQTLGNKTSVRFLLDCWKRVYTHPDDYSFILDVLSKASNHQYGRYTTTLPMAHKYGSYEGAINDCGVVFGPIPFAFVVLADGISEIDLGNIVNIMVIKTLNQYLSVGVDYNI